MAGTLFGLALSQNVDRNGKPAVCKLYVYAAGSFTTPVTAYKDFALTAGQEHPAPIVSDALGRLPVFWLADGNYAFRLTDTNGTVLASSLNVQALGPSSGGGGGGGSVDPNALISTGMVTWLDRSGTRAGYVRDNARTMGSATSGATERANSDAQACYEDLWNTFSDTICPVSGGRGISSTADWSANKPIALPDKRGYVPGGLDDMGNSAASRYSGVPVILGGSTTAGGLVGETSHVLSSGEIPALTHDHDLAAGVGIGFANNGTGTLISYLTNSSTGFTGKTSTTTLGGGGAHNITQRTVLGTFYRKL